MGVIAGYKSRAIETGADVEARRGFLRKIGYKL
jgi:adenosine/AMP kinase